MGEKKIENMSINDLKAMLFDAGEEFSVIQSRYNDLKKTIGPVLVNKIKEEQVKRDKKDKKVSKIKKIKKKKNGQGASGVA